MGKKCRLDVPIKMKGRKERKTYKLEVKINKVRSRKKKDWKGDEDERLE